VHLQISALGIDPANPLDPLQNQNILRTRSVAMGLQALAGKFFWPIGSLFINLRNIYHASQPFSQEEKFPRRSKARQFCPIYFLR
jgi:hypothetical protein